jgi:hypothetical protein
MVKYKFYKDPDCGSTARCNRVWKKQELLNEIALVKGKQYIQFDNNISIDMLCEILLIKKLKQIKLSHIHIE